MGASSQKSMFQSSCLVHEAKPISPLCGLCIPICAKGISILLSEGDWGCNTRIHVSAKVRLSVTKGGLPGSQPHLGSRADGLRGRIAFRSQLY